MLSYNGHLHNVLGALYVKNYFDDEAKKEAEDIVNNIRNQLIGMFKTNEWLDELTRERVIMKAKAMTQHIAHPGENADDYMDLVQKLYAGLSISDTDKYYDLVRKVNTWALNQYYKKLKDKDAVLDLFPVSPTMFNAFYNALENTFIMPAAFIHSPNFRGSGAPKSVNYAGVGLFIGHEMTHGFDNTGRLYDLHGNRVNWWTNQSTTEFLNRSVCFANGFSDMTTGFVNVTLNGNLTLGENIADAGGIKAAFLAYKNQVQGKEEPRLPGLMHFSHDQIFFISAAQLYCGSFNKAGLERQIKYDVHATTKYRVNMQMTNSKVCTESAALFIRNMNQSADPCSNFFEYACGGYVQEHPLGAHTNIYYQMKEFGALANLDADRIIQGLLKEKSSSMNKKPMPVQMVNKMYKSCLDTNYEFNLRTPLLDDAGKGFGIPAIHDAGATDRSAWADRCSPQHISTLLSTVHQITNTKLLGFYQPFFTIKLYKNNAVPEDKANMMQLPNDGNYTLGIMGPSIPDMTSLHSWTFLQSFFKFLSKKNRLTAMQVEDASRLAGFTSKLFGTQSNHIKISRKLSMIVPSQVITYNKLKNIYSFLDWDTYLEAILPDGMLEYFTGDKLMLTAPKKFITFSGIEAITNLSSSDCRTIHNYVWTFALIRILLGASMLDKELIHSVSNNLTIYDDLTVSECKSVTYGAYFQNVLGAVYLQDQEFFNDGKSKKEAEDIVTNIRSELIEMFRTNKWLDEVTRQKVILKAQVMTQQIGYPGDTAKGYMNLVKQLYVGLSLANADTFYHMVKKVNTWALKRYFMRLVDTSIVLDLFPISITTFNAFYTPWENSFVVPAAYIHPPNFHGPDAPKSVNYAVMGYVTGHEMTHGFDNMGRLYNLHGEKVTWWTNHSVAEFVNRSTCFASQYHDISTGLFNVTLNGNKTLGENIADAGGVKAAFLAYRKQVQGKEEPRLPGLMHLSHDQIFFISAAQLWCGSFDKSGLERNVKTNAHAITQYRIQMQMTNSKESFLYLLFLILNLGLNNLVIFITCWQIIFL